MLTKYMRYNRWQKFKHFIVHLFGWQEGEVISEVDDDGWIWIAFKCRECGKITGRYRSWPKDKSTLPYELRRHEPWRWIAAAPSRRRKYGRR